MRGFLDPDPVQLDINVMCIPKFALVPAKIARKDIKQEWTVWQLYKGLSKFEQGKSQEVKDLLTPRKNWTLVTSTRGNNTITAYSWDYAHSC